VPRQSNIAEHPPPDGFPPDSLRPVGDPILDPFQGRKPTQRKSHEQTDRPADPMALFDKSVSGLYPAVVLPGSPEECSEFADSVAKVPLLCFRERPHRPPRQEIPKTINQPFLDHRKLCQGCPLTVRQSKQRNQYAHRDVTRGAQSRPRDRTIVGHPRLRRARQAAKPVVHHTAHTATHRSGPSRWRSRHDAERVGQVHRLLGCE
jgi:hypothetical protein